MHPNRITLRCLGLAATACVGSLIPALATGFRLPDQDAVATARGEAFVATADNPSAVFYNPAGITQLEGQQIRAGIYGLSLDVRYRSPSGQTYANQKDLHAIPQLFYTLTPKDSAFSYGMGVYSPMGLSSEWPQDTGFRTIGTRGSLTMITLHPVAAWKVAPGLSISAGPTFNLAEVDLRQGFLTPAAGVGDEYRFKGNGWDPGFNAGVMWNPVTEWQFGLTYKSAPTLDFSGSSTLTAPGLNNRVDASTRFVMPQSVAAGISFRPSPKWNLEFDIDWTDWSRVKTLTIQQAPLPPAGQELHWRSSMYYEFGVTRYLDNGWSVSAGYIFNENSLPDDHYSPLVGDLDRHFLSAGAGWKHGGFSVDLAYQFGYGPERTVSGSGINAYGQSADGRYRFLSHALLLSAGWKF